MVCRSRCLPEASIVCSHAKGVCGVDGDASVVDGDTVDGDTVL